MARWRLLLLTGLVVAGCGGGEGSGDGDALADTAESLRQLQSGTLDLRLEVRATAGPEDEVVGFAVAGPFSVGGGGRLPVARLAYTEQAGTTETSSVLVATGDAAFLEVDGVAYELGDDQVAALALPDSEDGALDALHLGDWLTSPQVQRDELDGVAVDRITGEADVPVVLGDLLAVSAGFGAPGIVAVEDERAAALERAVRSSSVEVVSTHDGHQLRRLAVELQLGADLPEEVRAALEQFAGATVRFTLLLDDHGDEVTVEPPADPRPIEELG